MLCLLTPKCVTPWTWWIALREADQATWFGAWGAFLAFAGALWVYWRSERTRMKCEIQQRAVSVKHQAILLRLPLGKLQSQIMRVASLMRTDLPAMGETVSRTLFPILEVDEVRRRITDACAFKPHVAIALLSVLASAESLNEKLRRALEVMAPDEKGMQRVKIKDTGEVIRRIDVLNLWDDFAKVVERNLNYVEAAEQQRTLGESTDPVIWDWDSRKHEKLRKID